MICFLTSRLNDPDTERMYDENRLSAELLRCYPDHCRAVYVSADPDRPDTTDIYAEATASYFMSAGLRFDAYTVLDRRNEGCTDEIIRSSNLVILSGGHVPTQNRFFRQIGLRSLMKSFEGIVIGISAGSMNAAETVYAQPELEGESIDPSYRRFLPGLGLTQTMLLPHYQQIKDDSLDGRKLFDDITLGDSVGRTFYAICDGSYLLIKDGHEELRGEAYRIRDGAIRKITDIGDSVELI